VSMNREQQVATGAGDKRDLVGGIKRSQAPGAADGYG
jgi:hypothetical protein